MKKSLIALSILSAFAAHAAVIGPDTANTNLNTNNQGQAQGQAQGQLQGQAQLQGQGQGQAQGQVANGGQGGDAKAGAAAGAIAGAAAGAISGSASKSGSESTSGASTGAVDASSANSNGATANVNIEAAQPLSRVEVASAPTVYTPPALTTAVCVIGVSAGGSGMGWGFALGSGLKDEGCEIRALSQLMQSYGHIAAAKELICSDTRVAAAYKKAGTPCKAEEPTPTPRADATVPPSILVPDVVLRPSEG